MPYISSINSQYPASELFKPTTLYFTSTPVRISAIERRFHELISREVPPTEEEKAYRRRVCTNESYINSPDRPADSFDDEDLTNWEHRGIYWVRRTSGRYPNCHTLDRRGAHAMWRNPSGSYCCDGFPIFSQESFKRFLQEAEVIKPVLYCPELNLLLCLERDIRGPRGVCWGISTERQYFRVVHKDEVSILPYTKAALHRKLVEFGLQS